MPTYTLPSTANNTGIDGLATYVNTNVPSFSAWILATVYFTILLAGYFSKSRREGSEQAGDLPMWSAIAGLITSAGAFTLFLADGIVGLETVIITVAVTIISAIWFLFSSRN